MSFNSLNYVFIFLPLTVLGYYLLRRTPVANLFMTCASLLFYAVSAVWYLAPLFVTAFVDYFIGQKIFDSIDDRYRKRLLILSVVVNLALLSVFKYTGWLSKELAVLLGSFGVTVGTISIALPPAISFYTFQSMSYTIDIYRREFKPYRNAIDYISFVSFFPHLVAGPIMRARDLLPQLAKQRPLPGHADVSMAFFMILFGLFQKTVVADNVGGMVELVAQLMGPGRGPLPPGVGLLFMYGFAFQIYCDFAAYSTIARGSAKLFNVNLMRNFLTPYMAANPSEFWQRWHISLSTWLRDYLYIPLGGSKHGKLLTFRNLMLTMFLGGLWHGAGFFFILWGIYHGLLLVLYRLVPLDEYLVRRFGRFGKFLAILVFFHLVCFGWIFFRATPEQFGPIWNSILAFPKTITATLTNYAPYFAKVPVLSLDFLRTLKATAHGWLTANWVFFVYGWGIFLFSLPAIVTDLVAYRKGVEFPDLFKDMTVATKVCVILFLLYGIQFFGRREANEFIYFAF
jgi:D-alanyl-lipoteichoic acid acyltransferase DltB (MBOAT superfamily)